eukprot:COSAG03_NODE_1553_length_3886_cov_3.072089_1_plen_69_part_00
MLLKSSELSRQAAGVGLRECSRPQRYRRCFSRVIWGAILLILRIVLVVIVSDLLMLCREERAAHLLVR